MKHIKHRHRAGIVLASVVLAALVWLGAPMVRHVWQKNIPQASHPNAPEIDRFSLKNGMEVVVVENHRVPAVSHTLWLRTGAADDPIGKSGLAHYLEHLMFKGTPTTPEGQYDARLEALGAQFNAFTGADYTGYYVTVAREHLEAVMALEADRFSHLAPSDKAYTKERQVILEERRSRIDNNPQALLDEEIQGALFRHHPYHIPIIGYEHEMEALQPDDARMFYDHYYQPANMILVVAGDITRRELEPLAERYYGALTARVALPVRQWTAEPPQRTARYVVMRHAQVKQPVWIRTYAAPSMVEGNTKDALPLEVLAYWMGGSKTSLLYHEVVSSKKLASAISVSYSSLSRGPAEFVIRATPADGVSLSTLAREINHQVARIRDIKISPEDLVRIKTVLKAEAIYARDGLETVAQIVGTLRVLGLDEHIFTQWPSRIDAVTAEDVRVAAREVLNAPQSVTARLLPQPQGSHQGKEGQ